MKQKIYVKRLNKNIELPSIIKKGDWIDLRASKTMNIAAPKASTLKRKIQGNKEIERYRKVSFDLKHIPLGVAMLLPAGMEAVIVSRSSLPSKKGIMCANSLGVVDGGEEGYNGNNDEWKFPALGLGDTVINEGDRICQFRIQLSQKATLWQKIKWLLSSGIEIVELENLPTDKDRGGFGSTGE